MPGESILVVDDDDAIARVLVGLLKQVGYEARAVPSAARALEEIGDTAVDLVVTDVRMPGMDGMALLSALTRASPTCRSSCSRRTGRCRWRSKR